MSNPIESSSEEFVVWRKRFKLKKSTVRQLEDDARATVRSPEGMAAYIIEEHYKRVTKEGAPNAGR